MPEIHQFAGDAASGRNRTKPHFEVFFENGAWHWVLWARGQSEIVARSRESGYKSKSTAIKSLSHVSRAAWRATAEEKIYVRETEAPPSLWQLA
ncbi:MAG: hypothetical protein OXU81_24475 [Gammaproteobacteria bacterium]|nr:hypothetical protein [Gammaproteobacteria bacterium]